MVFWSGQKNSQHFSKSMKKTKKNYGKMEILKKNQFSINWTHYSPNIFFYLLCYLQIFKIIIAFLDSEQNNEWVLQ